MSKGPALLVIFTICLITLFLVMLYLMTTINPPPLARIDVPDLGIDGRENGQQLDRGEKVEQGHKIGSIFLTDPTTEFMLDKIEAEEIDFYQSTRRRSKYNEKLNGTSVFRYLHRKAVPPLWPRARHTIVVDPTMHIVMPPNWPTTPDKFEPTLPGRAKASTGVYLQYRDDSDTSKPRTRPNLTVLSPMKRRSINNVKLLNNTGSVILKILNGKGNSMIEIKVGSDNNIRKKKSKESQNSSDEESDLTLQLIKNMSHDEKSNNKSRSFTKDADEAGDRNITDSRNITATKYSNDNNNVAKNSSNLQTIANISSSLNTTASNTITTHNKEYDKKINNTEFMNMLFDDDVTNDTTINASNLSIFKNHTILLNNTVPSNDIEPTEKSSDSDVTIY